MFDAIADRFTNIFDKLRYGGTLTEENIRDGLRDVRRALLEADVNVGVVRAFIDTVTEQAIGEEILQGVNPGQQVVQIVHDELIKLMGESDTHIPFATGRPTVLLIAGLQGSGKTTTCAKLAKYLVESHGKRPLLVAADLQRPAAIEQLKILGEQIRVPVFHQPGLTPPELCATALDFAKQDNRDVVILDTAGRLHIDDALMGEVADVSKRTNPDQTYLVVDAMTGQDAVTSAQAFHERLALDGVIFTKLDGDSRGGAIVSLRHLLGKPIKFVGLGEKIDAIQEFQPDRYARRILGMGDILSLVEKAQSAIDDKEAAELEKKFVENKFDLGDFAKQLRSIQKMGSIKDLLGLIPGIGAKIKQLTIDESIFKRYMAMIDSMTPAERSRPELIDMSRRRRIANGAGVSTGDVAALLKQFQTMRKMMGKFGDVQDMVSKLPQDDDLTPEQLANPQAFMPNTNRLFAKRVDKKAEKKAKQAKKKARANKKKGRR
jgi:signal recognition particle subunit SRP54